MFHRQLGSSRARTRQTLQLEPLEARYVLSTVTGPSSSQTPYLVPTYPGVQITSIMTVGDSVNLKPDGVTPYRMVGIPDGLGAYDNNDGTFTLLMNHEIPSTLGVARAHGNKGAFVSEWVINKSNLSVVSVRDFLGDTTSIFLSNNVPSDTLGLGVVHTGFLAGSTTTMSRLCSADLADATAYYWVEPGTGTFYGTDARIFQTGEESGGTLATLGGPEARIDFGRQWNFIATDDTRIPGDQSNTAYEMPHCGLFAWENNLANPFSQRKTITAGMDDGSPTGQLYFWIGDKQTTGNVVERAGLTRQSSNDNLWVLKVPSLTTVDGSGVPIETQGVPVSGPKGTAAAFQLLKSGASGDASGLTFAQLEADSDSKAATQFLRPEDGHWDPNNPRDYYFVTTNQYDQVKDGIGAQVGRSRLYRLRFTDITNPEAGGTIECLLDGTEAGNMFDNMTMDRHGRVWLQEDVGNQQHNSKVWLYDVASGDLVQIAKHDTARFGDVGVPATGPFNLDEESSGIIDVSQILGEGKYLAVVQAHYNPGNAELVEGGQLVLMNTNYATAVNTGGVLKVQGTLNDDGLVVSRHGNTISVSNDGTLLGQFDKRDVAQLLIEGDRGNDFILVAHQVKQNAVISAGVGNDVVFSGAGRTILIGGKGSDLLVGGSDSDLLIGGTTAYDDSDAALLSLLDAWSVNRPYAQRVSLLQALLNSTTVFDDGETDILMGLGNLDWYFKGAGDWADNRPGEIVN
jgi:Ca2+-binding RTX toxin-like protein